MMRRPRWEALISALEAIQGSKETLTPDEVYTHLRCFEEKLKQAGEFKSEYKTIALPTHNVKHYNPSSSQSNRENFVQRLEHEVSKGALLLSKMIQGMLDFEKKYNKEREGRDKKIVCFMCHKEGQERRSRSKKDQFKNKKKARALNALWSDDSSESNDEGTDNESDQK